MQKLEIENYIARSLKVSFFYTQISDTNFLNDTLFPL